jgi:hypothetical protein
MFSLVANDKRYLTLLFQQNCPSISLYSKQQAFLLTSTFVRRFPDLFSIALLLGWASLTIAAQDRL